MSKETIEHVDNSTDINRVIRIGDRNLNMALLAPTANECNLWVKRIEDAKSGFHNSRLLFSRGKTSK